MKNLTFVLFILAILNTCANVDAQDVKNKEEMQNVFNLFVLKEQDFNKPLKELKSYVSGPFYDFEEIIEKPDTPEEDDFICLRQELTLDDDTKINADYIIFKTTEDAMKVTNFLSSSFAAVARVVSLREKEELGLKKYYSVFFYDQHSQFALRCHCQNICLTLGVFSNTMEKEETRQECYKYAKIVIERIKKMNDDKL